MKDRYASVFKNAYVSDDFGIGSKVEIELLDGIGLMSYNGRIIGSLINDEQFYESTNAVKKLDYTFRDASRNNPVSIITEPSEIINNTTGIVKYCDNETTIVEYDFIREEVKETEDFNVDELELSLEELLQSIIEEASIREEVNCYEKCECKEKEETSEMVSGEVSKEFNFGGKIRDGRFRMSINGLTVRGKDGKYYTFNPNDRQLVEVQNGFFDQLNDLLFYMPTMDLEIGDIVIHQDSPYYITSVGEAIKGINFENMTEDTLIPKTNVFGQTFYVKVFNCLGTNNILGSNLIQNPAMAYMLMGEKDMDLSKLMMFQAMQNSEGISDFSNQPWMMMALMGKDNGGELSDYMKMSLMAQMSAKPKATTKSSKSENKN